MSYTLCLVTASFLTALPGAGPADAAGTAPAPAVQQSYPPAPADGTPAPPMRLRDRIRNLFSPHSSDPAPSAAAPAPPVVVSQGQPAVVSQPRPAGQPSGWVDNQPRPTTSVTAMRPSLGQPAAQEPGDLDKCGHEKDYSWITGRLARDGGRWVIRYAGPQEIDRFGGRLVLTGNLDANKLRDGALVCVIGQVASRGRSISSGDVAYQVQQLNLVEPTRR